MPTVTDRVLQFAIVSYADHLQYFLDDPYGVAGSEGLPQAFENCRLLATDLGLDFDVLITQVGTPHEVNRLRELEATLDKAAASPPSP